MSLRRPASAPILGVHAPTPRVPRRLIHRQAFRWGVPFVLVMFAIDFALWALSG